MHTRNPRIRPRSIQDDKYKSDTRIERTQSTWHGEKRASSRKKMKGRQMRRRGKGSASHAGSFQSPADLDRAGSDMAILGSVSNETLIRNCSKHAASYPSWVYVSSLKVDVDESNPWQSEREDGPLSIHSRGISTS